MKTFLFIALWISSFILSAQSNVYESLMKNSVSLELDPAAFVLNGYSLSVKYQNRKWKHLSAMGSVFSSKFPDKMMLKSNYQNGWRDLRFRPSFALFLDYFGHRVKGVHLGASTFWYNKSAGILGAVERSSFSTIYPNIRVGYKWIPFKKSNLYINPWINFGKEFNVDDRTVFESIEFKNRRFNYIIALHIGYQFDL